MNGKLIEELLNKSEKWREIAKQSKSRGDEMPAHLKNNIAEEMRDFLRELGKKKEKVLTEQELAGFIGKVEDFLYKMRMFGKVNSEESFSATIGFIKRRREELEELLAEWNRYFAP
ncbi:MAG: hypothetical protein GF370_00825 [Candidatus Nealsonbacteria bacterium]|nr:hypothetical protein [Candidatus Nealsonbacteria bacterium]